MGEKSDILKVNKIVQIKSFFIFSSKSITSKLINTSVIMIIK